MIALTGATGSVGRALVAALAARGVTPRILARRDSPRTATVAGAATVHPADLTRPDTLGPALAGVRRLFLLTPFHPRQDDLQIGVIEAARQAGVEAVVKLSAWGANADAATLIHRQHGHGDRILTGSGLRYAVLRPNAFMQNAEQWLDTIRRRDAVVLPTGRARVSMIDVRDIAEVAAEVLTAPRIGGEVYDLTGPQALTYADVAATLSAAAGRALRHIDASAAEAAEVMLRNGVPRWAVDARLELYATYRAGAAARVTSVVRDVTGRPPRTFAELAGELAGRLREAPGAPVGERT